MEGVSGQFICLARAESSAGCRYISTVEETMGHTGAGRANCAGSGGSVANFAEYRIQLPESVTPSLSRMSRQH